MIEIVGPPAVGKTSLCRLLPRPVIPETQLELQSAGCLPSPGLKRQQVLVAHLLDRLAELDDHGTVVDSGLITVAAFTQLRFGTEGVRAILSQIADHPASISLRFSGLVVLDAPDEVLRARARGDLHRQRRHLDDNLRLFAPTRNLLAELTIAMPSERVHMAVQPVAANALQQARDWIVKRRTDLRTATTVEEVLRRWLIP